MVVVKWKLIGWFVQAERQESMGNEYCQLKEKCGRLGSWLIKTSNLDWWQTPWTKSTGIINSCLISHLWPLQWYFLRRNITRTLASNLLVIIMEQLVIALILFTSLGGKANGWHDGGMIYEFVHVSLGLRWTAPSNSRLPRFWLAIEIQPSASLTWTPCFEDFTCSRLEVPLGYANRSFGATSIAFIKLSGKNATEESPSIVLLPGKTRSDQPQKASWSTCNWTETSSGGPGGSAVDLLLTYRTLTGQVFGEQYNFVSFDPRGVNNSDLSLDCFPGNQKQDLPLVDAQHRCYQYLINVAWRTVLFKLYLRRVVQQCCR